MKAILKLDQTTLRKASRLTGIKEKTSLVQRGLEALIAQESARRLAALGGTQRSLKADARRRRKNGHR